MYFATEQCFYDKTLKSSENSFYNGTRHRVLVFCYNIILQLSKCNLTKLQSFFDKTLKCS